MLLLLKKRQSAEKNFIFRTSVVIREVEQPEDAPELFE